MITHLPSFFTKDYTGPQASEENAYRVHLRPLDDQVTIMTINTSDNKHEKPSMSFFMAHEQVEALFRSFRKAEKTWKDWMAMREGWKNDEEKELVLDD